MATGEVILPGEGVLPQKEEDSGRVLLSMPHITPKSGKAEFYLGGSLLNVSRPKLENKLIGGGRRGKIEKFTPESKLRLLKRIGTVSKKYLPHFLTLTYPADYPHNMKVVSRHFDTFCKRIAREFPAYGLIWKKEAQKRGAPHFHCMVWGLMGYDDEYLVEWFSKNWYEVVNSGDIKHYLWHKGELGNGNKPCIEAVRSWRGVWSYTAKYLGKIENCDEWEEPGRFWGVRGRLPVAPMVWMSLTDRQACYMLRLLRRACRLRFKQSRSVSGFVDAEYWFDRMDRLLIPC
jgi:hypothetical protein